MLANRGFLKKNILVLGLGISGIATYWTLEKAGLKVFAWDDNENVRQRYRTLDEHKKVIFLSPNSIDWNQISLVVASPYIKISGKNIHPVIAAAKLAKCRVIIDIELLQECADPGAEFIGITGTNGKSTTTALIYHIAQSLKLNTAMGGNIGVAAMSLPALPCRGKYILEISSYQLEFTKNLRFHIAVLLNITVDHLDKHETMDNYIAAKTNIFKNQQENDIAIICIDDEYTEKIYHKYISTGKGLIVPISTKKRLKYGIYYRDSKIFISLKDFKDGEGREEEFHLPKCHLIGEHNIQNILAAFTVFYINNRFDPKKILNYIASFRGLPHRIELVRQINNIKFINDSKATNQDAVRYALKSFDNTEIYWLAGGRAKSDMISDLSDIIPKIKHIFLYGEAKYAFAEIIGEKTDYTIVDNLEIATQNAYKLACQNSNTLYEKIILLSPACSSFDQFENFEKRGDTFKEYVNTI